MASTNLGQLIREARTGAGFTQEQLAKKISGLSALDISKAERGQKDLTQAQLKAIAKATGVTQTSLLEAAKSSSGKKTSSSKTSSGSTMKVTATEKKFLEAYRKADSDARKAALSILKGETTSTQEMLGNLLENAVEMLGKK